MRGNVYFHTPFSFGFMGIGTLVLIVGLIALLVLVIITYRKVRKLEDKFAYLELKKVVATEIKEEEKVQEKE